MRRSTCTIAIVACALIATIPAAAHSDLSATANSRAQVARPENGVLAAATGQPVRQPVSQPAALACPAPVPGQVLWKADAESAMSSEWASNSSEPAAAAPPNPDPTRIGQSAFRAQGNKSYHFQIRDSDDSYGERDELGQALPSRPGDENRWFRAGEQRWIAMQYFFPADWPADDTWQTVFQIKPVTPGGGGPDMEISAGTNRLIFDGNTNAWGSTQGHVFDGSGPLAGGSYPLTKGRWIKITWHLVFSADPSAGSVEVFGDLADGRGMRTLVPRRTRATMKYLDGAMDPVHLRVGIYRDPAMTATANLYVDGITVATTRAAAEANAYS